MILFCTEFYTAPASKDLLFPVYMILGIASESSEVCCEYLVGEDLIKYIVQAIGRALRTEKVRHF